MATQLTHPGRLVRQQCILDNGLTVADAARVLGVSRQTLNNLVNGRAGISPEMAVRLAKAFGDTEEAWMQLQFAYDLALVRRRAHTIEIHPIPKKVGTEPQARLI